MKNLTNNELFELIATPVVAIVLYTACTPGMDFFETICCMVFAGFCTVGVLYTMRKEDLKNLWNSCSDKFQECIFAGTLLGSFWGFALIVSTEGDLKLSVWSVATGLTVGLGTGTIAYIIALFIPKKTWKKIERFVGAMFR